jgi:hypothetical protein
MQYFSGSDVARVLGIKQKVLTQWIDRRLVIPSIKARGRGSKNQFSQTDIIRIAIMQSLPGVVLETAAAVGFCSPKTEVGQVHLKMIEDVVNSYGEEVKARANTGGTILGNSVFAKQAYLAIIPKDLPGEVAMGFFIMGKEGFTQLYHHLESEDHVTIINITKIVKRVIDGLQEG